MIRELINKYKAYPVPAKAAFWFVVCQMVQNGCRFLSMPILVRLFTTEQYGIYSAFLSWIQIISIFATLNLHYGVYNNAMFRYPDRRSGYTSASQSLAAVMTICCFVIYLCFSRSWNELFGLDPDLVIMIFVQILFAEGFLLWSSRQRFEYKYITLLVFTSLLALLYMIVPVVSAAMFPQEQRLRAVVYSGVMVQAGFGISFILYNYIKGRCFYNREFWKFALTFNIPLIPHYLSTIILGQADRVMIKKYIGDAEAGIYSFTYNIALVIEIITTSINNAIIPYTYEKIKARDYGQLKKIANFLLLMVGGMVLAFSAIAPEFIKFFATEEYYDAICLVPVISLSSYFTFLSCLFGNIEFFFEEKKFGIASVIEAVLNVVLNYLLLPVFGYYAAGYTTLFCYILYSVGRYVFMRGVCRKKLNGDKVYDHRTILAISAVFVLLTFGMMSVYDHPVIRISVLFAALAVCFIKRDMLIKYFKMIREENK